jgi:hypothetical protein
VSTPPDAVSLRDYLERLLADHQREHILLQGAIDKALAAQEHRFEGVNEFRKTLSDQAATFVSRETLEARVTALAARLDALEQRSATFVTRETMDARLQVANDRTQSLELSRANSSGRAAAFAAVGTLAATGVAILLHFIK